MKNQYQEFESEWKSAKPYAFKWFWRITAAFVFMSVIFGAIGLVGGFFSSGSRVVQKEFYPEAMLRKYEWFKDAAAQLDRKRADIKVYEQRLSMTGSVDRIEREQRMIWMTEVAGIKASYNGLAAEYNAQMAKFNWAFANVGQLPPGATDPLPREYKPYLEN